AAATSAARKSRWPCATARVSLGCGGIDVVRIKAELVVNLALLRIAEDIVGFGDLLEFFFCGFVAGIDVRMIFARKFAESLADLLLRGRFFHAERAVIILGGGWHGWLLQRSLGRDLQAFVEFLQAVLDLPRLFFVPIVH